MPLYGEKREQFDVINQSKPRIDGVDKVTGRAHYAADLKFVDMVYGGCLHSATHAHALVKKIDTGKARAIPGVLAVVTAADMPKPKSCAGNAPYMYLTDHVRYVGDVVAIVCAETRALVKEALGAIEVEYEDLPGVYTIRDAMKPEAPVVHENFPGNVFTDSLFHIRKGDVEQGFAEADYVIEREYETQYIEHSYIEPEAVVCVQNPTDGVMTVHSASQNPFFTRRYVADILGVGMNEVRVFQETLGGTFGGKEEAAGMLAARCAYLCRLVGRPVKMTFCREESFLESAKRHPFLLHYKAGVMKDGRIVAWEGTQIDNCGAYNNQTNYMNWRANVHSAGPYAIPNVKTDTFGVFTNNIHGGAMRGYSSPQLIWGQEQFIEEIAEEIGMDEVELRRINCLRDGVTNATGTEMHNVILRQVMDYTAEKTDYQKKHTDYKSQSSNRKRKGIGLAIGHRGCGFGAEAPDASGAMAIANEDGTILINSGLAENGQGLKTAYAQIAAEAIGVPYEIIRFYGTDTQAIADCGMTVASRGTVMGAQSVRKVGYKLNEVLRSNAIALGFFANTAEIEKANGLAEGSLKGFNATADDLELKGGVFSLRKYPAFKVPLSNVTGAALWSGRQLAAYEWFTPDPCIQDHHTGQGVAFPTYSYGCVVAEIEVDMETGYVDVQKVTASHDVGTAINPALVKGQIYGGIVMGQGFGITEEVEVSKGQVRNQNFENYILPTAMDMPEMDINIFECDDGKGTFGAKSIGEPATEVVGAAIANAVYNATGRRLRENPATLERVLLGKKLR